MSNLALATTSTYLISQWRSEVTDDAWASHVSENFGGACSPSNVLHFRAAQLGPEALSRPLECHRS